MVAVDLQSAYKQGRRQCTLTQGFAQQKLFIHRGILREENSYGMETMMIYFTLPLGHWTYSTPPMIFTTLLDVSVVSN